MEDCPLPSLICVFLFREFPDVAVVQHICLLPLCVLLLQRLEETPTLKLWHFLVRIGMDLMELLCIARSPAAAGRGIWCLGWSLLRQNSYEFLLRDLQWCLWLVSSLFKLNDDNTWAQTVFLRKCQGPSSVGNVNQVTLIFGEKRF